MDPIKQWAKSTVRWPTIVRSCRRTQEKKLKGVSICRNFSNTIKPRQLVYFRAKTAFKAGLLSLQSSCRSGVVAPRSAKHVWWSCNEINPSLWYFIPWKSRDMTGNPCKSNVVSNVFEADWKFRNDVVPDSCCKSSAGLWQLIQSIHGYSDDRIKVPKYLFVFCSGEWGGIFFLTSVAAIAQSKQIILFWTKPSNFRGTYM